MTGVRAPTRAVRARSIFPPPPFFFCKTDCRYLRRSAVLSVTPTVLPPCIDITGIDPGMVAVGCSRGMVEVFNGEGEKTTEMGLGHTGAAAHAVKLAWHPHLRVLASGWDNGTVVVLVA